ncbi:hypothetical protein COCSUDRAFT_47997 [Coccomyxa subellipsoidea C-169]|uniref:Coiled-coil domain-containing protein R3HCC1L n=1 Tax=Coccomyxa subellipsoidea (strain C-169) TaxID=574566 RepID=I0YU74_COCSC|nr:hypothetical protein COCSUDRAFT_47997 [Coccomyxa subellipsoidea C-169]EIE21943.1 hypothetical protein COCSUDRAFT_47997 [Coccomyxa subellipsoidea C-169]|eukprot:XP_005646487.1 hypothetical protein COCSUDRAFT_47997 [Coccomyxa subellipsoidea C-169]
MISFDEGELLERLKDVKDSVDQAAILREWEQNLGQITPPSERQPLPHSTAERPTVRPKAEPAAQRSNGAASRRRADNGPGSREQEEVEVPFDGRHILELHGLSSADTANQLETFLVSISSGPIDPVVRWVNDKTALAVFSNPAAAQATLQAGNSRYSMRPFSEACDASKATPAAELQPPRPRPKTSTVVANRLISLALNAPRVAEQELRQQQHNKKELKRERQKQVDASWDS